MRSDHDLARLWRARLVAPGGHGPPGKARRNETRIKLVDLKRTSIELRRPLAAGCHEP
jgi:hypothetical protein